MIAPPIQGTVPNPLRSLAGQPPATDTEANTLFVKARNELAKMQSELNGLKEQVALQHETPQKAEGRKATDPLMEQRLQEQSAARHEMVQRKRTVRGEMEMQAKERADQRAHELALQKQQAAQYKLKMRDAADRSQREEVESKIRDRARRLARQEAERRARAHVVRRSRELREMRERKALEAAEMKVVAERQAREDSEKRAKVERARMMNAEAKRKTQDDLDKKAQLHAVARRVELEQLRIHQQEERKIEQLKAVEATEKRLREKVERKERRMREDGDYLDALPPAPP
jgi:hypothetical protein